jgi:mono/diheme cytochrome c family protein
MHIKKYIFILGFFSVVGLPDAYGQAAAGQTAPAGLLERGRYLVEEVGQCHHCHTPKLEDGRFDRTRWLKGAVLDFAPMNPVPDWHKTSPDITGAGRLFERWGDKGMLEYLKTGLTPKGKPAGPPMPAYKLKAEDAEAVVAFLKSLQ